MRFFVTAPFSMEKPIKCELEALGIEKISVETGKVYFEGDTRALARACVFLRSGDRVFREITSFSAKTFDELFEGVAGVNWNEYISENGKIDISAKCARSQLMSNSDVQSITKKAIVKSIQRKTHREVLPERGEQYPIEVHIHNDIVTVALDCCGTSLHKRGYRVKNAVAPLRETFAAGLLQIAGYNGSTAFCDPFCGSGTLVIEAAMLALNIAPGMNREFVCESFKGIDKKIFDSVRFNARNIVADREICVYGSDISEEMTEMTLFHAKRAGVDKHIQITTTAAIYSYPECERGIMVTNPPYGERIGDEAFMQSLSAEIRELIDHYYAWDKYLLSGYKQFEKSIGLRADNARRFYNGNIECNLYKYRHIEL